MLNQRFLFNFHMVTNSWNIALAVPRQAPRAEHPSLEFAKIMIYLRFLTIARHDGKSLAEPAPTGRNIPAFSTMHRMSYTERTSRAYQ